MLTKSPIVKAIPRGFASRLAVAAATVGFVQTVDAAWPQWGGPKQNFQADAKGLATSWPEAGPKQVWKRDLGDGYSAILEEDGRLYTMYRGDNKEKVICLDAKTGTTVWETAYDSSPAEGHEHSFGDGPRATPLIVGDKLYTIGVSGTMHCLNKKDGSTVWKIELWKDMGGNKLNHGYSSSPIVYKDNIVVLVGAENASVVALNKNDGKVAWKKHSFKNSYSTPKIINIDGKDQLVTFMATEVIGLNAADGELLWQFPHQNQWQQNVCMPEWDEANRLMVISSPEAGARGLSLIKSGDKYEVSEAWTTRKIQFYHVNTVQLGDYVYGSTGSMSPAFFSALEKKTGKIAWRERGFSKATCVYGDGRFVILDEDGNVGLATATPEGLTIHSKATVLKNPSWTVPTLSGSRLYLRDKSTIMALDLGA